MDRIIDTILELRSKKQMKEVIWQAYLNRGVKEGRSGGKLRVLILNAPCNGFGDLIFAMKLANYVREWYGASVTIATPLRDGLTKLGWPKSHSVSLSGGKAQCRRFKSLKIGRRLPHQDLIFAAPIHTDFHPEISDIRKIVPYASKLNTFMFSEYNDSTRKGFDFDTGVGGDRCGLLLTDTKGIRGKPKKLRGKYALAYIADPDSIPNADNCLLSFIEMIAKKYRKHTKLSIVVPKWVDSEIEDMARRLVSRVGEYYASVAYVASDKRLFVATDGPGQRALILRGDILPVPNDEMIRLMKGSVADILLTGDQSLTDGLSCCSRKNIFYQIAPWKESLGRELAKLLPNPWLKKKRTSCGTRQATAYRSSYSKFVKDWDFRKLARPKMDAIVARVRAIKKDRDVAYLAELVESSRSVASLKKKVREEFLD